LKGTVTTGSGAKTVLPRIIDQVVPGCHSEQKEEEVKKRDKEEKRNGEEG
jgi:hypothetical protein